ncbi:hypothetical protein EUX98_g7095 [Antrodiella citrinella]|uniref:F-box domain-containing protein n=1 Tax=Antrodiella citrinella TaxID=2447956 RepID=A0A4S4MUT3_9APHY|nr:hypothetical protein EUX98_g7095 [Antrodiella citrinella]
MDHTIRHHAGTIESAQRHLPHEMVDNICGYLDVKHYPDKQALAACTLVCRHWHTSARAVLFERIIVPDIHRDFRNNIDTFGPFLESIHMNGQSRSIKHVIIAGNTWDPIRLTAHELSHYLAKLPALHTLELWYVLLKLDSANGCGCQDVGSSVSLEKLTISSVKFEISIEGDVMECSLVETLELFRNVKSLQLRAVQPADDNGDGMVAFPQGATALITGPISLRIAELKTMSGPQGATHTVVLSILQESCCLDELRKLEFWDTAQCFDGLAPAISDTLEDLLVSCSDMYDNGAEVIPSPYLGCFTRLSRLTISGTLYTMMSFSTEQGRNVRSRRFSSLIDGVLDAPPTLSHLKIDIECDHYLPETMMDRLMFDWEALDQALEDRTQLVRVIFGLEALREDSEADVELLRTYLSRCQAKGILEIQTNMRKPRQA